MARWWLALGILVGLVRCAPATAAIGASEAAQPQALAEILALPPELRSRFHAALAPGQPPGPGQPAPRRIERIVAFVFAPEALGMRYREGANHSVAESYATREANCLGFTLLFLALAREVGLPAGAQEFHQTLSWSRQDETVYRNSHVNAWVRVGGRQYVFDVAPDSFVSRHAPRKITDRQLLAHYYNNRAMNDLAQGALEPATALMQQALALQPERASHWSNAGVLQLRRGDPAAAEAAYRRALQLDPRNVEALFNSISLAQRRGDARIAARLRAQLEKVQQRDPFHHFLRALDYERDGDLQRAIEHYRRASRLQRSEPRFHAALARAYRQAGDERRAAQAQARADAAGG